MTRVVNPCEIARSDGLYEFPHLVTHFLAPGVEDQLDVRGGEADLAQGACHRAGMFTGLTRGFHAYARLPMTNAKRFPGVPLTRRREASSAWAASTRHKDATIA